MRTPAEIIERMKAVESEDFFGFVRGDLLDYLPFEDAKPLLKEEAKAEDWGNANRPLPRDHAAIISQIRAYLPFAWDKANNCRGISAARSLQHMQAWLWMLGEDAAAQQLDHYTRYGKPQLRAISEHFGVDWIALDDGHWVNNEGERGVAAAEVSPISLPWNASVVTA